MFLPLHEILCDKGVMLVTLLMYIAKHDDLGTDDGGVVGNLGVWVSKELRPRHSHVLGG